jgi:hypothetical protein
MKNAFVVSAAVAASLVASTVTITGCSSSKNNGSPSTNNGQAQNSPAWTLSFSATCPPSTNPEEPGDCAGLHGFRISSDKSFVIGPATNGETKTGNLTDEDFNSFHVYFAQILGNTSPLSAGGDNNHGKCEAYGEASELQTAREEHLTLSIGNRESEISVLKEGQLCSQGGNFEAAKRLHSAIQLLVGKYYTLPFPNPCTNAVDQLHSLFADVQKCSSDNDCFYVGSENSFAELIPPGTSRYVVVDNCSAIPQLAVANAGALSGLRSKLEAAHADAEKACSRNLIRESCTEYAGFDSSLGAPVCEQGSCRVTPKYASPTGH